MPKRNISGLLSKCKELWSNIIEIKDIITEELSLDDISLDDISPSSNDPDVDAGSGKKLKENAASEIDAADESEDDDISLNTVKELFEDYIGIAVVGFVTYKEDILDIEKRIQCKIITKVDVIGNAIFLTLGHPDSRYGGYVKITPIPNGQFAELKSEQESSKHTRYRLTFYGGDSIEYIDKNNLGQIYYSSGYINKS